MLFFLEDKTHNIMTYLTLPSYQNRFNQGKSPNFYNINLFVITFVTIAGKLDVSTGIIFSIYTVGQMAGSLFAGQICDRYAFLFLFLYELFSDIA